MEFSVGPIRYARAGSDDVAWSESGTGPPMILGGWWMSHLERDLEYVPIRSFLAALSAHRRVLRTDPIGSGLSRSRRATPSTLTPHVDALTAVLDDAGVERTTVLAGSSGCPVAIAFAAHHPDRVERLVLCGSYLDGATIASASDRGALMEVVRRSWGVSARLMCEIFYPDATPDEQRAYLRHQRTVGSPDSAAAALAAVYAFDARAEAEDVRAPTLVLHRRGDRAIPLALGVETANAMAHARLAIVDGTAHHPWHGDSAAIVRQVLAFDGVDPDLLTDEAASSEPAGTVHPGLLSEREREVLLLVARGMTDTEIAAELYLSPHTVHRHIANVRSKLGVPTRAAAAAWAAVNLA
ncbi:alpha/beta fold hydrolase [Microbacterium sp. NPDC058389]|uniref:alpha/beta fold hydrolase n=1 Tax=Microbacterium sp. NPDC058389 TaxID=3346475 RepID=UPI0036523B99